MALSGDYSFQLGNYAPLPIELVRGEGCWVWDLADRKFLDFCMGIAVCSLGHCHPRLVEAFQQQSRELWHVSNLYRIPQQAKAAEALVDIVGHPGKIFFCNSGAEANELAYKITRKFGNTTRGTRANPWKLLTFNNGFHGRTLAGVAATAQGKIKAGFEPDIPGFVHAPLNDIAALHAAVDDEVVAILVEPIQGEGGIHVASSDFLHAGAQLCRDKNMLLMFDEVQSGLGRAGAWNAWEACGASEVKPDVVTWAKGMGGGFPVGAVFIAEPYVDLLPPGSHGTTYGGSPLASRIVSTVLDVIKTEHLIENVQARSAQLRAGLQSIPLIEEVRGLGLMLGLVLKDTTPNETPVSRRAVEACLAEGLLVAPAGTNVIRLLPPLNVAEEEVAQALEKLAKALLTLQE